MKFEKYFYNCSEQYIDSINPALFEEIIEIISKLPKRSIQAEINKDLFWIFTEKEWSYDSTPPNLDDFPPRELELGILDLNMIKQRNKRELCITSTTLGAKWHVDFAKMYQGRLVQVEAQFGKVESMFKDFCGFRIARYEKRLSLGIEIVMLEPTSYFPHHKDAISGMAYFGIAKKTLPAIGLNCPILLIGLKD